MFATGTGGYQIIINQTPSGVRAWTGYRETRCYTGTVENIG
jgi:hypothetical protein